MGTGARTAVRRARPEVSATVRLDRPLGPVLEFMRSMWGVNHGLESTSRRMKARFGVTGTERMVIRLVARYPGISAGQLAQILRVHPSTLTTLLKRLVKSGIVVRGVASVDGRRAVLTVTPKGAAIDEIRRGTVETAVRTALSTLPRRNIETAVAVLEALIRAFE